MTADFLLRLIADYLVIVIALVGGGAVLLVPAGQRYVQWARALMTGLVALLSAKVLSLLYQGERPFETLGVEPGAAFLPNPGFPSDHALLVFTVACVVWMATKNKTLTLVLFAAGAAVAAGRVAALVHTPLDVIGGAVCAIFAAVCIYGRQFFTLKRQI